VGAIGKAEEMSRVPRHTSRSVLALAAVSLLAIAGCGSDDDSDSPSTSTPDSTNVGLANPASEYCVAQGGEVEIVDGDAGQEGICVLPDGTRIDEWEYFRANNGSVPTTTP